jgi:hypothetical protein
MKNKNIWDDGEYCDPLTHWRKKINIYAEKRKQTTKGSEEFMKYDLLFYEAKYNEAFWKIEFKIFDDV